MSTGPTALPEVRAGFTGRLIDSVGVVIIGRNEGERLKRCLESVCPTTPRVVYVDSGSTDDSVNLSQSFGAAVVQLDPAVPFTAARARNAGCRKLLASAPGLDYVFFVDGDCEVSDTWIGWAVRFLDEHPDYAVVWGRRRERYPEKSIYNALCNFEWEDYALGETKACGGDVVMRVTAFNQAQGYNDALICGEEPELCVRLRRLNWRIWHADEAMTLHDANMLHFSQWWKRMLRGGYAYAQGVDMHGAPPERHCVAESRRVWIWGLGIPLAVVVLAAFFGWRALLLLGVYPLQVARIALRGTRSPRDNWLQAGALVIGKFAEVLGQIKFVIARWRRVQSKLIEYK